jgi:hypothetical protein
MTLSFQLVNSPFFIFVTILSVLEMELLMFAGAGSVGKTTLMDTCAKMASGRGLTTMAYYSSTRETYARHGLTNESDALKDPEFNRNFQHQVMSDNIERLYRGVSHDAASRHQPNLILADRSPYDYAGYYFTVFSNALTLETIKEKREQCDQALLALLLRQVKRITIVMLPYPTSWATDTESSDGWRADKTGKNFVWSNVVEAELEDAKRRLASQGVGDNLLNITRLDSFFERGSKEVRAAGALSQVFPHLR